MSSAPWRGAANAIPSLTQHTPLYSPLHVSVMVGDMQRLQRYPDLGFMCVLFEPNSIDM
jgi:hypothetical protein